MPWPLGNLCCRSENAITMQRVLEEYRRLAFNDVTNMIEIRPATMVLIKSTDELTPEQQRGGSVNQTD